MKVSIITVVYNNEATISDAIKSVIGQTYNDIEYILVDGASTDGTMEIIDSFRDDIDRIISEPDKGIYDAMNKGIKMSTGDVVGILNSDDFYHSDNIIEEVVDAFKANQVDAVYGDLIYVDPLDTRQIRRYWKSGKYTRKKFIYGWMPPHPTFFVKQEIYQNYGTFDLALRSAADYEFMLRVLFKHEVSATYIPQIITTMRDGGNSNASFKNRMKGNAEDSKAWKMNGLSAPFYTRYLKPLRKVNQFFKRPKSDDID